MADIHHIAPDPSSLMDSSTSTSKIPALIEDGSNWILYKAQFMAVVHAKGLRRYLEGRERKPVPLTAYGVDSDADERYETAYDKWAANHATIKSLLFQTAPEPLKLEIMALSDARAMWAMVTSRYDNQGDFVQVNLAAQMQQLRCGEGEDPRPVLAHLRAEYAAAGGVLSDDQYKVHVLGLLSPSYRNSIRGTLLSAQATGVPLSATALITAINAITCDEYALSADTQSTSALAARSGKCSNCGKEGHWFRDCWSKGGGAEGKGPGKGKGRRQAKKKDETGASATATAAVAPTPTAPAAAVASVAATITPRIEDYTFWDESTYFVSTDFAKVSSNGMPISQYTCLIDSGASRHFEPHRNNFVMFHETTPIPIDSADGHKFYATGTGSIRIAIPCGNSVQDEFILHDVLYAPSMPISLISVSRLTHVGFRVHFERNACKITTPIGNTLVPIPERHGVFPLFGVEPHGTSCASETAATTMSALEFHHRMGHAYPPSHGTCLSTNSSENGYARHRHGYRPQYG